MRFLSNNVTVRLVALATLAFSISACSGEEEGPNILDAAMIYNDNKEAFAEVILTYPGPFFDFTRIPSRDPSNLLSGEKKFLKRLREKIPVEFIDFFPRSQSGLREVDVVIKRYGINSVYTVVSVVYFSEPLGTPKEGSNIMLYESCDDRSLEWIEAQKDKGSVTVFCKLNSNWYAMQKVG